jgi:hypothetical protein
MAKPDISELCDLAARLQELSESLRRLGLYQAAHHVELAEGELDNVVYASMPMPPTKAHRENGGSPRA